MFTRVLGVGSLAIVVLASSGRMLTPPAPLRAAHSQVFISSVPLTSRTAPSPSDEEYSFIPDPMLRERADSDADRAYHRSVENLLAQQNVLATRRENVAETRLILTVREGDVIRLQRQFPSIQSSGDATDIDAWRAVIEKAKGRRDLAQKDLESARRSEAEARASVDFLAAQTITARQHWEEKAGAAARQKAGLHGTLVQRATLLVMFHDDTTYAQMKELFRRHRLEAQGSIPSISLFTVTSLDEPEETPEAEATRLRALIQKLEESPLVEVAAQNSMLDGDFLPRRNCPTARKWFGPENGLPLHGHVQAWNFRAAMIQRPTVGILDTGFDSDSDIVLIPALEAKPIPPCASVLGGHGSLVAGTVGATFDNQIGTDGAATDIRMVACAPPRAKCDPRLSSVDRVLCTRRRSAVGFINGLATLLAQNVRIVNASVGYGWHNSGVDPLTVTEAQKMVESHGKMVRKLMKTASSAILVSSAGNDFGMPAMWGSPFNWAALGSGTPASNIIVVEAMFRDGTRLPNSNADAMIKAAGIKVVARIDPSAPHEELFCEGTSGAAPLVTATVAMMRSLNPFLAPGTIKSCLGIRAGTTPTLRAFESVQQCVANPEMILGDLDDDLDVDDDDFLHFKRRFKQVQARQIDDFNEDTIHDEKDAQFLREDLNGDKAIDERDLDVMIFARHLNAIEAAELKRRLHQ